MTQIPTDLKLSNYHYDLPASAIAQRPMAPRDHARLMVYDQAQDQVIHDFFYHLPSYLPPDSLLVANDSQVVPCRLLGHKTSGGKVEILVLDDLQGPGPYRCLVKASGKRKCGELFHFAGGLVSQVEHILAATGEFMLSFNQHGQLLPILQQHGLIPIPPYIRGGRSDERDNVDYQTFFAAQAGSLAAPTAGLHFTAELLSQLATQKQVTLAPVTLHVGRGTFAPVKSEQIDQHQMHGEYYRVPLASWQALQKAQYVTAIGTTALRTLESARRARQATSSDTGERWSPDQWHQTNLFLYPGELVSSVDALITNFHLPQSTLLMLVSALIGRAKALELYALALEKNYRFFSYGDAMLIVRSRPPSWRNN